MDRDDAVGPVFGADGHLDEAAAHAFVDGAFADAARVVRHLRQCARCAALVAEARGFVAAASGVLRRLDDGPAAQAGTASASVTPLNVTPPVSGPSDRAPGGVPRARAGLPWAGLRAAGAALVVAGLGGSAYYATRAPAARSSAGADATADALASPAVDSTTGGAGPSGVVVGHVRDAARRPLGAATVVVVGTGLRATTDDSGRFSLHGVPAGPATLRAQRIGYGAGAAGPLASGGVMRSDRPVRRTGAQVPNVRGCFAITSTADDAAGAARQAAPPSRVQLGDGGAVLRGGAVRGTWTLVGADSLRIAWTDAGRPALALRRDGAGWAGSGVRLAPVFVGEPCGAP